MDAVSTTSNNHLLRCHGYWLLFGIVLFQLFSVVLAYPELVKNSPFLKKIKHRNYKSMTTIGV